MKTTTCGQQLIAVFLVVVVVVVTVIDLVDAKKKKDKPVADETDKDNKPVADETDKDVRALQDDIENGVSPGLIMPQLMDLLHQIKTRKTGSCPCRRRKACRASGGICVKNTTTCNGTTVDVGCRGDGCTCCIQSEPCWIRKSCRKLGGHCVSNCSDCTGPTILYSGCKGNCACCAGRIKNGGNLTTPNPGSFSGSFAPSTEPVPSSIDIAIITEVPSTIHIDTTTPAKSATPKPGPPTQPPTTTTREITIPSCAEGFFPLGDECFKVMGATEDQVQWGRARRLCTRHGRHTSFLAEPKDSAALAQYVYDNFVQNRLHHFWLGGRGDGFNVRWESSSAIIPLYPQEPWQADQPSTFSENFCLDLRIDSIDLSRPLAVHTCSIALAHCYICESSLRL